MGTGRELWTQQGERICLLIAHSMLHLFGYDHMEEEERKDMEKRQEEILTKTKYTRDERGLV